MREIFKKEKEKDEIFYSSGESSNNPMAEKLAKLKLESENKNLEEEKTEEQKPEEQEKIEEPKPQKQTEEDLIKAALGEDVFERPDKELEEPRKPRSVGAAAREISEEKKINKNIRNARKEQKENIIKDAYDKQIFNMESELRNLDKSQKVFDKVATPEQKEERKKKIAALEQGIKDARNAKEAAKLKWASKKSVQLGLGSDIGETQSKTQGKTYSKGSTPEDAKEKVFKQKEVEAREKNKNLEEKENKIEIVSPAGRKSFNEEQLKEAQKAREDLEKTKEKIVESERVIESGDIHGELVEPTPGEETLEEKTEKLLAAAEKQEEKKDQEIKREKPWIREKVEKAAEWYKKQPLKYKIMFSLGCVGTGLASAAVGGITGSAFLTIAFIGKGLQRAFGGAATFAMVEGLLKRNIEEGKKRQRTKFEATRHTIEAAVLGILVGSGTAGSVMGKGIAGFFIGDVQASPIQETPSVKAPTPIEPVPKIEKPEILTIGNRGPEGAIIDHFKNNPDIAKKLGWDGNADLDKWAGTKAHQLWLADAKEALVKPEILAKLKELGYPEDAEGYAKMMHRIGKGFVELDSKIGEINLVDTEYLKARVVPGELPTGSEPIKVPPEYFDGSKKMLYEEQLDELNEKYPTKEISTSNVQNWLEDKLKVSAWKSDLLNEKTLERLKIKDVMDSGFAKPQGVEAYTTAAPEWGSPQWGEMKEKVDLQDKIGKILRAMPTGERIKFQDNSVLDFLKEYLKTGGK